MGSHSRLSAGLGRRSRPRGARGTRMPGRLPPGPFKRRPRPRRRRRHHAVPAADRARPPLPGCLRRRARAHLPGGEARRRAAAARGRDRAALRAQGLQAGGAEAGAGLGGAAARALRRAARASLLWPAGGLHGLGAGGGHGVAGAGRGARLEDAHRGHRPGRRRAWHHPRGLLRRGWQERDPRQRLGGERPPRDRALVPRRRAAVLGGQRRALAVRVAPPAPPVCGPPWPAALTSISLHNKVKQILNAPPGLDPGTRSYDVKTFITYRADTWVRLQGQSLRRITTQPLPPAAPTRLAPESLHSPVGTDKGLDVHHSGEWQGGGEKPAAARGCGGGWLGLWGGCPRSVLLWWEVGGLQGLSSRSKAWTWAGQGGGSPGRHPAKPAGIHA